MCSHFIMNWNNEIEDLLERIRLNSIVLANKHRANYYEFKNCSKYFDVPIIFISTLSASFSVGAQSYLEQGLISTITCGISMSIAILSSIKLYLGLEDLIKLEQDISKSFNLSALDLYKTLHLNKENRNIDGLEYLNKRFADYTSLIQQSQLLRKSLKRDELMEIDKNVYLSETGSQSSVESPFDRSTNV